MRLCRRSRHSVGYALLYTYLSTELLLGVIFYLLYYIILRDTASSLRIEEWSGIPDVYVHIFDKIHAESYQRDDTYLPAK
jgi:hypothetical protein